MVNFVHNIKNIQTLVATTIRKTPLGLLRKKNPQVQSDEKWKTKPKAKKGEDKQSQWDLIKKHGLN